MFINPCDVDGYNQNYETAEDKASKMSKEALKESSKMNILSNIFIGKKVSNSKE